jgi:hypothetical protein
MLLFGVYLLVRDVAFANRGYSKSRRIPGRKTQSLVVSISGRELPIADKSKKHGYYSEYTTVVPGTGTLALGVPNCCHQQVHCTPVLSKSTSIYR